MPITIEFGFTDVVTPTARQVTFPTLLQPFAPFPIRGYPIETTIAEKFAVMVEYGMVNTRFKDYYDLWAIATTHKLTASTLLLAIQRTFAQRALTLPHPPQWPFDPGIGTDEGLARRWVTYARNTRRFQPQPWAEIMSEIAHLLVPLCRAHHDQSALSANWSPEQGWVSQARVDTQL